MATVITISGKAEAGKDSVALILKEELKDKKVCIIRYGDYVKFTCKEYLGWDGIKDEAGRTILQEEGTDFVRSRDYDFWVTVVRNFVNIYKERFDYFLVPDTRFPNEIEVWHNMERITAIDLRVIRLNHESKLTEEQRLHASETSLDNYFFCPRNVITSESGLDKLRVEVLKWIVSHQGDVEYGKTSSDI